MKEKSGHAHKRNENEKEVHLSGPEASLSLINSSNVENERGHGTAVDADRTPLSPTTPVVDTSWTRRLSRSSNKATWCDAPKRSGSMCQHGPKAKGRCRSPAPLAIAQSALPARSRTLAQSHCHFNFFLRGAVVHPVRPWPIKSPKHLFSDFPPFLRYFSHSFLRLFFFFLLHYLSSDPVTSDLLIQRETRGPFVYVHSANCTCKPVNNADERLKIFTMQSASSDEWPK